MMLIQNSFLLFPPDFLFHILRESFGLNGSMTDINLPIYPYFCKFDKTSRIAGVLWTWIDLLLCLNASLIKAKLWYTFKCPIFQLVSSKISQTDYQYSHISDNSYNVFGIQAPIWRQYISKCLCLFISHNICFTICA